MPLEPIIVMEVLEPDKLPRFQTGLKEYTVRIRISDGVTYCDCEFSPSLPLGAAVQMAVEDFKAASDLLHKQKEQGA